MQKVLTTARFTLEDRSHSEVMKDEVLKFDWPEVRLPPTDHGVAPVQRPCLCGQSFLDKYRSQYSYTASRGPAKQLHKYMDDAIEILEKQVFNVNEEMEILSLSTKNILTDGMLLLQGVFVMEALAVAWGDVDVTKNILDGSSLLQGALVLDWGETKTILIDGASLLQRALALDWGQHKTESLEP